MRKTFIMLLALLAGSFVYGQTDSLTKEERLALDSMFRNDEFIKLMMKKNKSYFDINAGIGNSIFSINNNALNVEQAQTEKLYYIPSAGYYHQSGLSISISSFLADDKGSLKMYQWAISPGYVYSGKKISAGISYTRFIEGASTSFETSPFKNDIYGSLRYKKTWIEPGIAAGIAFGRITDHYDTAFWDTAHMRVVHLEKEIITRISGFSLTLSASHRFTFEKIFGRKDAMQIQPAVLLNGSSQRWTTTYTASRVAVLNLLKRRYGESGKTQFKMQSAAFMIDLTYYYGKFYIQPQGYFDYYLGSTSDKRLTTLFSVTAGFML